jgi:hypothetical protein
VGGVRFLRHAQRRAFTLDGAGLEAAVLSNTIKSDGRLQQRVLVLEQIACEGSDGSY